MIEKRGLIRTGTVAPPRISSEQKAQLLRKGNELFNNGQFELAEKIFITLGYSDGLTRLGDHYFKKADYPRAALLYKKAPDLVRFGKVCERMAMVVRLLLKEASPSLQEQLQRPNQEGKV